MVIIIGFVVQKNFRAPYFQALPRSWRERKRIPLNHVMKLNEKEYKISDISQSGCFCITDERHFTIGQKIPFEFICEKLIIQNVGEIVRISEDGIGIRFFKLNKNEKNDIKIMIKDRFALRYSINIKGTFESGNKFLKGSIYNISRTGLFICVNTVNIEVSEKGICSFKINNEKFLIGAKVAWVNYTDGGFGKPEGIGLRFTNIQWKLIKKIKAKGIPVQLTR
jgi:Tfp pilus assembly protein PilZ